MVAAIDLFAGFGGFTTGARSVGVDVQWAANHWPEAVKYHALNHPDTKHECQDLHQVSWSKVPRHRLLLASPSCTGHAKCRGTDKPHHDEARSTAWAVVSCAEYHRPQAFIVENVPEFLKWTLYRAWKIAMQDLGYSMQEVIADAADQGVPQNRVRLFIVGLHGIHAPRITLPAKAKIPASAIIDFDDGQWSPVEKSGRAQGTLWQYQEGKRQGLERFLMPYYGAARKEAHPIIRRLDRPIGTITTDDRYGIVRGDEMRMLSVQEARKAMSFPDGYKMPSDRKLSMKMLGNAVCPQAVAPIIQQVMGWL